jgi:hypothetical protein
VPTDHLISSQLSYLLPLMLLCISFISFVLFAYLYAEFSVSFDYAVLWIFLQLRGLGLGVEKDCQFYGNELKAKPNDRGMSFPHQSLYLYVSHSKP